MFKTIKVNKTTVNTQHALPLQIHSRCLNTSLFIILPCDQTKNNKCNTRDYPLFGNSYTLLYHLLQGDIMVSANYEIEKMYEETLFVCTSSVGRGYVVLSVSDIEHLYVYARECL